MVRDCKQTNNRTRQIHKRDQRSQSNLHGRILHGGGRDLQAEQRVTVSTTPRTRRARFPCMTCMHPLVGPNSSYHGLRIATHPPSTFTAETVSRCAALICLSRFLSLLSWPRVYDHAASRCCNAAGSFEILRVICIYFTMRSLVASALLALAPCKSRLSWSPSRYEDADGKQSPSWSRPRPLNRRLMRTPTRASSSIRGRRLPASHLALPFPLMP